MADFIVLRTWHGRLGGTLIKLPEGKVISDSEYEVPRLQASGLRAVPATPQLLALLTEGDDDPGSVSVAGLVDVMGEVATLRRKGEINMVANAVFTAVSALDVPTKVLGSTFLSSGNVDFDSPGDGQLRYIGEGAIRCFVSVTMLASKAVSDKLCTFFVRRDAITQTGPVLPVTVPFTVPPAATLSWSFIASPIENGQSFELFVTNQVDDDDILVPEMLLSAFAI